ncbi:MAG TPA: ATP-binding protein [Saprospiraceae bacterium]|nr:ATP-binding protein [Saprospiraceae bacterium]
MDQFPRIVQAQVERYLRPNKVVVLLGPRRVGKTFLIRKILSEKEESYTLLNGEDIATRELFARRSQVALAKIVGKKRFLIIDEAQKIPDIGNALKLMVDTIDDLKILITGSSAFDVENYTGEPLTGRKMTFNLYSISEQELAKVHPLIHQVDQLHSSLVYGNYPELLQLPTNEEKYLYLRELLNSYLLKDILTFETIKNSDKIIDLLRLIAYQVGSEVSIPDLSKSLQMSRNTVDKYLDLLTKVFIITRVGGFSRNMRKEVNKSSKYYFLDNGIRNVLVGNLNPVHLRNDMGILWENYMISERIKFQHYNAVLVYNYFWRTYDQQEIDWVEDRGGQLYGYEFKWNPRKKVKAPAAWGKAYPDAGFKVITPDNYREWLIPAPDSTGPPE